MLASKKPFSPPSTPEILHNATPEQLKREHDEKQQAFLKKYEHRVDQDGYEKPTKVMQYKGFTIVDYAYTVPRCMQVFMGKTDYPEVFDGDRCIAVVDYTDKILKSGKVIAPWLAQEVEGCVVKISPWVDHSLVLIMLGMIATRFANMHYII